MLERYTRCLGVCPSVAHPSAAMASAGQPLFDPRRPIDQCLAHAADAGGYAARAVVCAMRPSVRIPAAVRTVETKGRSLGAAAASKAARSASADLKNQLAAEVARIG